MSAIAAHEGDSVDGRLFRVHPKNSALLDPELGDTTALIFWLRNCLVEMKESSSATERLPVWDYIAGQSACGRRDGPNVPDHR
jgi:hypothetical protein